MFSNFHSVLEKNMKIWLNFLRNEIKTVNNMALLKINNNHLPKNENLKMILP